MNIYETNFTKKEIKERKENETKYFLFSIPFVGIGFFFSAASFDGN